MYHQFNIQQSHVLPTHCIYVFCVDLRTNSQCFPIQHQQTGFYNQEGVCLLCGKDRVFKCDSGWFSPLKLCDISSCDPEPPGSLMAGIKSRLQLLSGWPLRGRGRLLRRLT
jgi:hypothetical protein